MIRDHWIIFISNLNRGRDRVCKKFLNKKIDQESLNYFEWKEEGMLPDTEITYDEFGEDR